MPTKQGVSQTESKPKGQTSNQGNNSRRGIKPGDKIVKRVKRPERPRKINPENHLFAEIAKDRRRPRQVKTLIIGNPLAAKPARPTSEDQLRVARSLLTERTDLNGPTRRLGATSMLEQYSTAKPVFENGIKVTTRTSVALKNTMTIVSEQIGSDQARLKAAESGARIAAEVLIQAWNVLNPKQA